MSFLEHTNASLGIYGNIVFDSVTDAEILGEAGASSFEFHVQNGTSNGLTWNVNTPIQNETISGNSQNPPFRLLAPGIVRLLPITYDVLFGYLIPMPSILLYASANITDDQGGTGTLVALDPPMKADDEPAKLHMNLTTTVVGCNLQVDRTQILLDTASKNITAGSIAPRNPSKVWQNWKPLGPGQDPLVQVWGSITNIESRSPIPANWAPQSDLNNYLTLAEFYLNNQLRLQPGSQFGLQLGPISLADLELGLENMTAIIYWAYSNLPLITYGTDPLSANPSFDENSSPIGVVAYVVYAHLNINTLPLLVGFMASLILLLVSLYLTSRPDQRMLSSEIHAAGVLQLMWLLGKGSPAQDQVADVKLPSTDNLRKAGLVNLKFGKFSGRGSDKDSEWADQ
ncbi:hypothetical protein BDP27DRAFT_1456160 [Rhodocollybia butyracea]|uniref:Uncharacterized protein n=1 Tax=Rhodocollybia butyracea TaxID=206335 RepID=A0A9P5P569_9AGAR|nr:hypothetical protein BDP27DRAFT_1456160 [Rhodocollybia butyracea]